MELINSILNLSALEGVFSYWYYVNFVLSLVATVASVLIFGYFLKLYLFFRKNILFREEEIAETGSETNVLFSEFLIDSGYFEQVEEVKQECPNFTTWECIEDVAKGRITSSILHLGILALVSALLSNVIAVIFFSLAGIVVARITLSQKDLYCKYMRNIDIVIEEEPQ